MAGGCQEVCRFLENHWCRNQVFRTAQFSSALLSGLCETDYPLFSHRLAILYRSLGGMRIMARFLDDLPALAHLLKTLQHIQSDTSLVNRLFDLTSALCGFLYHPVEHIAWLAESRLLSVQSDSFWTTAINLWALPLCISTIRLIVALVNINQEMKLLWRRENLILPDEKRLYFEDKQQYVGHKPQMAALMMRRFHIILSLVQSVSDLMNAVHWMPEGFLWAGKLSLFWVGVFGTLSSVIGLYKILPGQHVV